MPRPLKKRRVALPQKVGKHRQYLLDNFSDLPDDVTNLKKGHLLLLHASNDSSGVKTIQALAVKYPCTFKPAQLNSVLNQSKKYQNISRDADFQKYSSLCREPFTPTEILQSVTPHDVQTTTPKRPVADQAVGEQQLFEAHDTTPCSPSASCASGSSVRSSVRLKGPLTPRKMKMKKRLEFVSESKRAMEVKYKDRLKSLRSEYKDLRERKHLNQEINRKKLQLMRKDQKIKSLRMRFSQSTLARELMEAKEELRNAKRRHERLKKSKKSRVADGSELQGLKDELAKKNVTIRELENEKLWLEETVEALSSGGEKTCLNKEGKTYSVEIRQLVFDAVENNVPTKNIPILIEKFAKRSGIKLNAVPHRSTVEMMTRELGAISDFQAAEMCLSNCNLTLGFDATTQEGVHVNSVHVTSPSKCHVVAIDQLAGGTAEDYSLHIDTSINRISDVYCKFYSADFSEIRSKILQNISNTITDRAAVNHATIQCLEAAWRKNLNELNCHLHPLDTIASSMRSALKSMEPADLAKKLWGAECIGHQIILAVNKFRYKDGRGDPKGFTAHLEKAGLPKGLIPRYRGNRLHVMFHISAQLHHHREFFQSLFEDGLTACGGLLDGLRTDFVNPCAQVELQVLGLIGKLLSGPWMTKFYTGSEATLSHVDAIGVVKGVVDVLREFSSEPMQTLTTKQDFFGNDLDDSDPVVHKLQDCPVIQPLFVSMMGACLSKAVAVLEKQYHRYFGIDVTEKLREETESARCHNIDAEQVMGMFSAAKERAPNATLCFISSRIRAQKNSVTDYLDSLEEEKRTKLIELAIKLGRMQRQDKRKKHAEVKKEIANRLSKKAQKKKHLQRNGLDRALKKCEAKSLDIAKQPEFKDIEPFAINKVKDILDGRVVGYRISHIWFDEDKNERTVYFGKIEKLLKRNGGTYRIGYWKEGQSYDDDAEDYDISKYSLAVDLICEDLVMS